MSQLRNDFGDIDIYLFDQLLRGRIAPGMRVLDVGCGTGRNLVYLLKNGYEVAGCDRDPTAVATVRALAARLAPNLPDDSFRVEPVERMSFPDASADIISAPMAATSSGFVISIGPPSMMPTCLLRESRRISWISFSEK